jgi:ribonuclease E
MDQLDLPQGMSVIARTAGIGRTVEELQWDLNYLMQLWGAIDGASKSAPGAFLIYQESSLVIRAIRDYFQPDIGEILIDTDDIHEQAQQFMSHVMPDMVHRVKRYRDDVPLFSRFQIEHQIETAYSRTVPLPSGGAIVIDHTEALVSIDVNSARATRGSDIETTAFNTNLEAADEVARQLRLRDLGGLIVIDFIDMENAKNQREIETRLKDALHYDRARVQMGKISRFGLMELSRQRLRPSLSEGSHVTCPRCNGTGHIRDTESSALQVLRIVQEEAMKENSAAIHVQAPVDVAAFLLNEKRGEILKIETRHRVSVILIPNKHLETPHYKLERIKHDDPRLDDLQASYKMAEEVDTDIGYSKRKAEEARPRQEAMVKSVTPDQPAPIVERKPVEAAPVPADAVTAEGFLSRLFGLFRTKSAAPAVPEAAAKSAPRERNGERGGRNRRSRGGRGRDKEERVAGAEAKSAKETPRDAAPKEAKEPRQPRQPRENREPREPRDAREGGEPRRERAPRPPREDRNPVEEVVLPQAELPLNTEAAIAEAVEPQIEGEAPEGGEEQPRRRRRRGGRNRNRRDREAAGEAGVNDDVEAGEESAESIEAEASAHVDVETPHESHDRHALPAAAQPTMAEPVAAAAASPVEAPAQTEVAVTIAETSTPVADVTPVAAVVHIEPAPPVIQEQPAAPAAPVPAVPAPAAVSVDIDTMLRAAGLHMASTDPERLRAVQTEQAAIAPSPHIPRERKPLPPELNEPLQQVETRR